MRPASDKALMEWFMRQPVAQQVDMFAEIWAAWQARLAGASGGHAKSDVENAASLLKRYVSAREGRLAHAAKAFLKPPPVLCVPFPSPACWGLALVGG